MFLPARVALLRTRDSAIELIFRAIDVFVLTFERKGLSERGFGQPRPCPGEDAAAPGRRLTPARDPAARPYAASFVRRLRFGASSAAGLDALRLIVGVSSSASPMCAFA